MLGIASLSRAELQQAQYDFRSGVGDVPSIIDFSEYYFPTADLSSEGRE
jgi:hypothetical protein